MAKRRLLVLLPPDEYQQLEHWAEREERTLDQQASYVLRQALTERWAADGPLVAVPKEPVAA